jgi:hypothetical protein
MLRSRHVPILGPQIRLVDPPKLLEQHLKAHLCHGRVIAPLAELIPDKRVLSPRELVEAEDGARLAELGADEVAARIGYVGIFDAEDEGQLGAVGGGTGSREAGEEIDGVVAVGGPGGGGVGGGVGAEGAGVDVCGEVGDAGGDAGVELSKRRHGAGGEGAAGGGGPSERLW